MSARRIFIGDIHGHYDGLMRLMDAIAPQSTDQLVFVGDLIDRGPKSAQVVEFVRQHHFACVMGNHEQLLLEAFPNNEASVPGLQNWLVSGGRSTLNSYSQPELFFAHLDWLRQLPLYLDLGDIWVAHAGVHPGLPVEEQTANELCWIRETFHRAETPYFADKLIIVGHTITFNFPGVDPGQIVQGQGWLDIDTGAYHPRSGWLTAIDVDNQLVYQTHVSQGTLRTCPYEKITAPIKPFQLSNQAHK